MSAPCWRDSCRGSWDRSCDVRTVADEAHRCGSTRTGPAGDGGAGRANTHEVGVETLQVVRSGISSDSLAVFFVLVGLEIIA